jgi:hypothetical protein
MLHRIERFQLSGMTWKFEEVHPLTVRTLFAMQTVGILENRVAPGGVMVPGAVWPGEATIREVRMSITAFRRSRLSEEYLEA